MQNTTTQLSEKDLIALIQEDGQEGIAILYDKYSAALYGVITKIVQSEEVAQDILQDTFISIWQKFSSFNSDKGRLFTWMLNIARNKAIDYIRSKDFRNSSLNEINNIEANNLKHSTNINIDQIGLLEVIDKLPPEIKLAIDTVYLKGYSHQEAADYLKIPLGTIKTRVRNGLIVLRKFIK